MINGGVWVKGAFKISRIQNQGQRKYSRTWDDNQPDFSNCNIVRAKKLDTGFLRHFNFGIIHKWYHTHFWHQGWGYIVGCCGVVQIGGLVLVLHYLPKITLQNTFYILIAVYKFSDYFGDIKWDFEIIWGLIVLV